MKGPVVIDVISLAKKHAKGPENAPGDAETDEPMSEDQSAEEQLSQDILEAIKDNDPAALAETLETFFSYCSNKGE